MAVSLARHRQYGAKKAEANRLAKEYERQQKKAKSRGFFSNILSGVGGKLLGGALSGALGIASGGLLTPLIMAGSNMLAKGAAHKMTEGMGADPSELASKSKYGYGREEAKTLREGLEEQIDASDPWSQKGGFGKELFSSYLSAGLSGGLTKGAKGLLKGGEGSLGEAMTGTESGKLMNPFAEGGLGRAYEGAGAAIGLDLSKGEEELVYSPLHQPDQGPIFEEQPTLGPFMPTPVEEIGQSYETDFRGGGMVSPQAPTIVDYFGQQGVSLGGSSTRSLAQMLGKA